MNRRYAPDSGRSTRGGQILRAQRWIDGREFEQADQCNRQTPFVEGVPIGKIHTQRAHWPSVRLRQELGHVALDGTKIKANASKHKAMSYERMGKRAAEFPTARR